MEGSQGLAKLNFAGVLLFLFLKIEAKTAP